MTARRFTHFACLDWSGARGERQRGIALAVAEAGRGAPRLVERQGGWSRQAVLDWLLDHAGNDMLVGIDFSAAFPFADRGAYFPGWSESPPNAHTLWALVDDLSAGDPHLGVGGFVDHLEASRHFRRHGARRGDLFAGSEGRFRVVEARCRDDGHAQAVSSFNLVGAAQVGKASLAGMRLLHRLDGRLALWPFDPVPAAGAVLVELYTTIAARAAGVGRARSKLRDSASLDAALAQLGSDCHAPLAGYDDHSTDAMLGAAWLRRAADDQRLWNPIGLTPALAATEGWTFGVP